MSRAFLSRARSGRACLGWAGNWDTGAQGGGALPSGTPHTAQPVGSRPMVRKVSKLVRRRHQTGRTWYELDSSVVPALTAPERGKSPRPGRLTPRFGGASPSAAGARLGGMPETGVEPARPLGAVDFESTVSAIPPLRQRHRSIADPTRGRKPDGPRQDARPPRGRRPGSLLPPHTVVLRRQGLRRCRPR